MLWTLLALFRVVPPNIDDLFFIGPAWQLALDGSFIHPWLHLESPPFLAHGFHLQPPFYSYVLAGWLMVFGLSTSSLLLFHAACGLAVSLAIGRLFHRFQRPLRYAYLLVIAYVGWAAFQGLRQDSLAMVFLSMGILVLTVDTPARWFGGSLLLGAAVGTSSIQIAYVLPAFTALAALHLHAARPHRRYLLVRGAGILLAAGLLLLLFLGCIRFQWGDFWHDFRVHAGFRRPPAGIPYYLSMLTSQWRWLTDLPVTVLFLGCVGIGLLRWRQITFAQRALCLALPGALLLNVFIYAPTFVSLNLICCTGLLGLLGAGFVRPNLSRLGFAGLCALLALNQSLFWLRTLAVKPPDGAQVQTIRQQVASHPERLYAIDHAAARHVFDYQFPPHTLAWDFLYFQPHEPLASMKQKASGQVWIVARSNLGSMVSDSGMDFPRVKLLGRTLRSMPAEPYDFVMVE